jgi:hypothetical protein
MILARIIAGKLLVCIFWLGISSCTSPTSESANTNNQEREITKQVSEQTSTNNQACTLVKDGFGSQ